eukprot:14248707-Alexandrium_andersonii.AAC.1
MGWAESCLCRRTNARALSLSANFWRASFEDLHGVGRCASAICRAPELATGAFAKLLGGHAARRARGGDSVGGFAMR